MSGAPVSLNRDELVASGRAALLAGDHARARELLDTAVRLDPGDADAWVWLSGTHSEPAEMAACLNRALALDPHSYQAREGLSWIAETYGEHVAYGHAERPASPAVTQATLRGAPIAEAAVHPLAAGALLGLARLAAWLQPDMLAELQGAALGFGGALLLAVAAAAGHAAALLVAWAVLGAGLGAARGRDRGDTYDSLRRAGAVFEPGLLWCAALVFAALGLLFAPPVWPAVVLLCWAVVVAGAVLMALRLRAVYRSLDVAAPAGVLLAVGCVAVALIGCWLAGVVGAAVL